MSVSKQNLADTRKKSKFVADAILIFEKLLTFRCVGIYLAAKFILLYKAVTSDLFVVKECNTCL